MVFAPFNSKSSYGLLKIPKWIALVWRGSSSSPVRYEDQKASPATESRRRSRSKYVASILLGSTCVSPNLPFLIQYEPRNLHGRFGRHVRFGRSESTVEIILDSRARHMPGRESPGHHE